MKFIFHGGAGEVGKSCIELQVKDDQYILDAGVKFTEKGYAYPEGIFKYHKIDGLFLSHAHLDHSGGLPLFEHKNMLCPIFCTEETKNMIKILLKDSYKIARIKHIDAAYQKIDLKKVQRNTRIVQFDKLYNFRYLSFKFFNAGHIPGSASIWITAENKKIVYSGDIKTIDTAVMKKASTDYGDVDVLITESTYGGIKLPDREELKKKFLDKIEETIARGGSVLIPTFALGRAQEILVMLSEKNFDAPIYFDGMCVKMTKKIIKGTNAYLNNEKVLRKMLRKVKFVKGEKQRNQIAAGKRKIFLTTSGMVQGGPVMHYLKYMWENPKNSVLLMGFQCKRTNGRHLYEDKYVYIKGWKTYVNCEVQKYEFSGHADDTELKKYVEKVDPKVLVVQHGDKEHSEALASWAKKHLRCRVVVPKIGDVLEI